MPTTQAYFSILLHINGSGAQIHNKCSDFVSCKISTNQLGFLASRSYLQQLLILVDNASREIDRTSQVHIIYMDFQMAFVSVPHKELFTKLWVLGIKDDLWLWFKAYLLGRLRCVSINGQRFDLLPVLSGVPQGSLLGTKLFVIYMNNLTQSITHSIC